MADIHCEGCSQRWAPQKRHTAHVRWHAHYTPRKLSSWDRGGDQMHPPTPGGDCTRQAPGHLSCSDLGRAQNADPTESVPLGIYLRIWTWAAETWEEHATQGPPQTVPRQSNLEPEKCRPWNHTRSEQGQTQCSWNTLSTPHTHQGYLFAVFLPPHSTTEQVSLNKWPPRPLVSGRKLDTEETSKQKKLK